MKPDLSETALVEFGAGDYQSFLVRADDNEKLTTLHCHVTADVPMTMEFTLWIGTQCVDTVFATVTEPLRITVLEFDVPILHGEDVLLMRRTDPATGARVFMLTAPTTRKQAEESGYTTEGD